MEKLEKIWLIVAVGGGKGIGPLTSQWELVPRMAL
jgi:hypothetical protein